MAWHLSHSHFILPSMPLLDRRGRVLGGKDRRIFRRWYPRRFDNAVALNRHRRNKNKDCQSRHDPLARLKAAVGLVCSSFYPHPYYISVSLSFPGTKDSLFIHCDLRLGRWPREAVRCHPYSSRVRRLPHGARAFLSPSQAGPARPQLGMRLIPNLHNG